MFDSNGIQLIIFDFDGVIVESNGIKDKVFREIFNRFPEHSEDFWQYHRKYVSVSRYTKFDYVLEKTGRQGDTDFRNELAAEFSKITLELMQSVPFVKGAKEFLTNLHTKFPLYLASVTPQEDLDIIIDNLQLRSFFKKIYGCPPWVKADAIRDIMVKENRSPAETVLIGDSYGDQRAANETGIHFIGRDSGLGFEEPQPIFIVPDLTALSAIFTENVQ